MYSRFVFILSIFLLGSLVASTAWAQSEDAVVVLLHGGVDSLRALDLDADDEAVDLGDEIIADDLWASTDFKRLPGGSHLLAQASGAGFAILNPDGSLQFQFDESMRFREIASASVAGYVSLTEPSRILLADSFQGIASIRDIKTNQIVWFQNFQVQGRFPVFAQAIVIPDAVAVAATWPSLGISAIDVFRFEEGGVTRKQYANVVGVDAPPDSIGLPELDGGISDIYGLADGAFLVSTPFTVFRMTANGMVDWLYDIRDVTSIGGEIEGARLLDSGRVAFITFERGKWVSGDPNHRVHWIDPSTLTLIASSEPLERAPAGLDVYAGHGGTGTRGFEAGLGDLSLGSIEDLESLGLAVGGLEFERGDLLRPQVNLQNQGMYPVVLPRVTIVATAGECGQTDGERRELASAEDVTITPATSFRLTNELSVDFDFEFGVWCARVEGTDFNGNAAELGTLEFDVVEMRSDADEPVDITELDFRTSSADMGGDAGETQPPGFVDTDSGCGCSSSKAGDISGWLVLLVFGLFIGRPWVRDRVRR